jgi:hypothetical protein
MNSEIRKLEDDIFVEERNLQMKKVTLDQLRRTCPHKWSPVTNDPIVREGYQDPGDPVGTMGVDWRGPMYVPRQGIKRWKRSCSECGTVEYTSFFKEKVEYIPVF